MDYILGIDIGTTATKGILYDENAQVEGQASKSYPLIQDQNGKAVEDPEVIFSAVQDVIFKLSQNGSKNIKAISWSAQMHSLIGLDKNKQLLTNSITWADNRSQKVVQEAKNSNLADQVYSQTGMPPHAMAPIYKLMWLKNEHPQLFEQANYWIGIKEYVVYRLTNKLMTDTTMAAGTGLFNLKTQQWDSDMLEKAEIKKKQLPEVAAPTMIVGNVLPYYAQKLGLQTDTKVILGASDGYSSTIGVNVLNNENFAINVGTSAAIRVIAPYLIKDAYKHVFCYPVDHTHYLVGGPINNGGIVLQWAKNALLGSDATFEDYLTLAAVASVGSKGLLFYPYLGGERAPIWNSEASGSFVGLTRQHQKAELARAVIEGLILNMKMAAEGLLDNVGKPRCLKLTGGFTKSNFICQLIADIFNLPTVKVKQKQSGAFAAMFLARQALGKSETLNDIKDFAGDEKIYFPNEINALKYQKIFTLYKQIEHDLEKNYHALARLKNELSDSIQ